MKLRDYQQDAVESTEAGWADYRSQLGTMATGGGKTIVFSHLAARQEGRTLILCHRKELINQAVDKLNQATGIFATVEQAGRSAIPGHGVTVASVQTIGGRLGKYAPDAFSLIICDEAHHVPSPEWRKPLDYFAPCPRLLGVTATPDRADRKALARFFQRTAFNYGMLELMRRKYLSDVRIKRLATEIDVRQIRLRRDATEEETADALHPRLAALAREVALEAWDRKMLVFLPTCEVSERFGRELARCGIEAAHVSGACKDRDEKLKWFATPGPKALCNAMLLTEGYDCEDVDCILCLRLVGSRALYTQIIGRGTRLSRFKDYLLVLDPLWISGRLDICCPADLTAETVLERDALRVKLDLGMDYLEAEVAAKVDVEARLAKQLAEAARPKPPRGFIRPEDFALAVHNTQLAQYEPITDAELAPASLEQLGRLASFKLWCPGIPWGHAQALLERLQERDSRSLATPAMVMRLKQFRDPNASIMTARQALTALNARFRVMR